MTEPTNDIEALLRYLKSGHTPHWYDDSTRWHAALTALVAERNALRKNTTELESELTAYAQLVSDLIAEKWRLQDRIKELESQEFTLPHDPFRNADRDLRERLVCAIWPVLIQQWREYKHAIDPRGDARSDALVEADAMIAAMRKGDTNGK